MKKVNFADKTKIKDLLFRPISLVVLCVSISIAALFGYVLITQSTDLIKSDATAYYAYLPSVFIHGALDHRNVLATLQNVDAANVTSALGLNFNEETSQFVNKYPIGTAILQAPFFLVGHVIASVAGDTSGGFSFIYQLSVYLSALFYLCLSIYLIWPVLRKWFNSQASFLSLLTIILSTNLIHYFTYDAGFSHVYSLALFSALLNIALIERKINYKLLTLAAILCGLVVLVRPTNIIFLLIFLPWLKKINLKQILFAALVSTLVVFLQLLAWKSTTGFWITFSYPGEGFNFLNPQILEVLFSVKKGWIFWTPAVLLMILGIINLYKKQSKQLAIIISAVLIIHIYIVASWWAWSYGYSYGHRAFTEYLVLLAIPLASLWQSVLLKKRLKYFLIIVIAFLSLLNLNNMQLYWRGYIYPDAETWPHYKNLILNPCLLEQNNCKNIYADSKTS